ncbi:MAG: MarR family transcriptional regulator [Acidimicrobiia bacterium]|nr:MarR family transcriptional regulator [Acidimicrobiia bacterium]MDH3398443.1 MarR family transcriptional regulator [Acidimicrobiia bacterium]MDH5616976.1 MarR family transcriptional regulator [Acidimicrobiia bacterium]
MNYQDTNLIEIGKRLNVEEYQTGSIPDVFQLVKSLGRKLKNIQRQTVGIAGVTPPQFVVLGALWEQDARPLKELADAAHCTRATITGIVDILERKGLVTRQPNPGDRRSLLVTLTEQGKDLEQSTPTLEEMLHGCCAGLRPEETTQLVQLLAALDRSLALWEARP